VAASVFFAGLLRIRSFNALEPKLSEKAFVRLVGAKTDGPLSSVDTLSRALRVMDLGAVRALSVEMLKKAERNKIFREGWYGALRYFAIDGWEPFCSRHRHCEECLVRRVRIKATDGTETEVEEYYHRFVVAFLIGERFDLLLDFEPLLPKDLRPITVKPTKGKTQRVAKAELDEGELTTALRLLKRVKETFPWLDVVVGDALYPNGPFLDAASRLGLGAVVTTKKQTDEPLREALRIWGDSAPQTTVEDEKAHERIELWDCPDLETLDSYHGGKIRCVRARLSKLDQPKSQPSTWCMLVTGAPQRRLSAEKVLKVARARWHIENTAFHQWVTHWQFNHVFTHQANAIRALFWLFFAAFNLLTLFLYCQVRSYGRDRGKVKNRTISRLVDEMRDDLVRLGLDTS
jgi:Transposase DDE domain